MGNNCCSPKDIPNILDNRPAPLPANHTALEKSSDREKIIEKAILKIQCLIRGFLARRKLNKMELKRYKLHVIDQLLTYSSAFPNFNNRNIPNFYFGFDDEDEPYADSKELRGPTMLENGGTYFGEW